MRKLSLFSGICGIDLAAHWAGMETVAFCEREPFPQKVIRSRFPGRPIYDDVCTLTAERLKEDGILGPTRTIDIISAGYPCQPFSNAGKREGAEDNRHLWPEVKRLLEEIRPAWFLGENVAGHITLGLDGVLADLENLSYSWETFFLPASAVGAPHQRERVFVVAYAESINDSEKVNSENSGAQKSQLGSVDGKEAVSNTNSITRLQTNKKTGTIRNKRGTRNDASWSNWGYASRTYWDVLEPPVFGVVDGVSDHMDRVRALGNAVVPQQIYPILAAIKQINDSLERGE